MRIQLITSYVNQLGEYEYLAKIVIDDSDKIVVCNSDVIGKTTVKRELSLYGADVVEEYELDKETTKEVRYYVKFKVPKNMELLVGGDQYLNYRDGRYFFGTNEEYYHYKTKFTRDEIEEFGIEHPEIRREDLEFIEVVE